MINSRGKKSSIDIEAREETADKIQFIGNRSRKQKIKKPILGFFAESIWVDTDFREL